jgi:Arc/MetJ-type ribon-helix-helix transcriptional regulator
MHVRLSKPELERFVAEKVRSGHVPTPEAVVEDALVRMQNEDLTLTEKEWAAIREADKQIDHGECIDFDTFAAAMRAKHGIK